MINCSVCLSEIDQKSAVVPASNRFFCEDCWKEQKNCPTYKSSVITFNGDQEKEKVKGDDQPDDFVLIDNDFEKEKELIFSSSSSSISSPSASSSSFTTSVSTISLSLPVNPLSVPKVSCLSIPSFFIESHVLPSNITLGKSFSSFSFVAHCGIPLRYIGDVVTICDNNGMVKVQKHGCGTLSVLLNDCSVPSSSATLPCSTPSSPSTLSFAASTSPSSVSISSIKKRMLNGISTLTSFINSDNISRISTTHVTANGSINSGSNISKLLTCTPGDMLKGVWENDVFVEGSASLTLTDGMKYEGGVNCKGQLHGKGLLYWNDENAKSGMKRKERYEGEWKNGVKCGQAVLRYEDGGRYGGNFERGRENGYGEKIFANGNKYEGLWMDGKMHGMGRMQYVNGGEYTGEFAHGEFQGKGVIRHSSGDVYEGDFVCGQKEGLGTLTSGKRDANGHARVYVGEFRHNIATGQATVTWPNGERHVGLFVDNLAEGHGMRTMTSGEIYEGNWARGLREGHGRQCKPDGSSYVGEFHDDQPHGKGTLTGAPQSAGAEAGAGGEGSGKAYVYVGEFRHGKVTGHGQVTWPNGEKHVGRFVDNIAEGYGVHTMADGQIYKGNFVHGLREGSGVQRMPDGSTYAGSFRAGRRDGTGTMTVIGADGVPVIEEQRWKDGVWVEGTVGSSTIETAQGVLIVVGLVALILQMFSR